MATRQARTVEKRRIQVVIKSQRKELATEVRKVVLDALQPSPLQLQLAGAAWDWDKPHPSLRLLVDVDMPSQSAPPSVPRGNSLMSSKAYYELKPVERKVWRRIRRLYGDQPRTSQSGWLSPLCHWSLEAKARDAESEARSYMVTEPWGWQAIGKAVAAQAHAGIPIPAWDQVNWETAANCYRLSLDRKHRRITTLGGAVLPVADCVSGLVAYEGGYPPLANEAGDTHGTTAAGRTPFAPRSQAYDDALTGIKALLKTQRRICVVGEPGIGRTTLLQRIVMACVNGEIPLVPIYVDLPTWQEKPAPGSLLSEIARELRPCGLPNGFDLADELLSTDKALVLLDGLDEAGLPPQKLQDLVEQVRHLVRSYPTASYVLTDWASDSHRAIEGFAYARMTGLNERQIEQMVDRYFRIQILPNPAPRDQFWAALNRGSRVLRFHARNPLHLMMMLQAFEATGATRLPDDLNEIYDLALTRMISQWQDTLSTPWHEPDGSSNLKLRWKLVEALSLVAIGEPGLRLTPATAEAAIRDWVTSLGGVVQAPHDAKAILQGLQVHNRVLSPVGQHHRFSHSQLAMVIAARALSSPAAPAAIGQLRPYCSDERWRDVVRLSCARLGAGRRMLLAELALELRQSAQAHHGIAALLAWTAERSADRPAGTDLAELRAAYALVGLALDAARSPRAAAARALDHAARVYLRLCPDGATVAAALTRAPLQVTPELCDSAITFATTRDARLALDIALALTLILAHPHHAPTTAEEARTIDQALEQVSGRAVGAARDLQEALWLALSSLKPEMNQPDAIARQKIRVTLEAQARKLRVLDYAWDVLGGDAEAAGDYFYGTALLLEELPALSPADRGSLRAQVLRL